MYITDSEKKVILQYWGWALMAHLDIEQTYNELPTMLKKFGSDPKAVKVFQKRILKKLAERTPEGKPAYCLNLKPSCIRLESNPFAGVEVLLKAGEVELIKHTQNDN